MKLDEAKVAISVEAASTPGLALLASFLDAPGRGIIR
jgi:hypothetical protein